MASMLGASLFSGANAASSFFGGLMGSQSAKEQEQVDELEANQALLQGKAESNAALGKLNQSMASSIASSGAAGTTTSGSTGNLISQAAENTGYNRSLINANALEQYGSYMTSAQQAKNQSHADIVSGVLGAGMDIAMPYSKMTGMFKDQGISYSQLMGLVK